MIPSIAIVGGGVAGWMAAAALAKAFEGRGQVQLVETADQPPEVGAEGTLPSIRAFHAALGIDEADLVRSTGATFKLGVEFTGGPGGRFFQPFGSFGASLGTVGFHHAWLRLHEIGEGGELQDYCLAAVAASLGRFQRPSTDPSSVLASYDYGLHLDAAAYTAVMRDHALARGVLRRGAKLSAIRLDGVTGSIAALETDDGETVTADLYVDCTAEGRLIRQALGAGWEDWSRWLPCDRMATVTLKAAGDPPPFTRVETGAAGWRWRIPLRDRVVAGQVYCQQAVTDEDAVDDLLSAGAARSSPLVETLANGRLDRFWIGNCVALGDAAGTQGPLAATRLHLIQTGLERLIGLLPSGVCDPADAAEYDRLAIEEHDRIRDFLILHHWAGDGTADIPDTLAHKIELFRSRGRIAPYAGETFLLPAWLAAFEGVGVRPRNHHPFADGLEIGEVRGRLQAFRTVVRQAGESMPSHAAFLAGA